MGKENFADKLLDKINVFKNPTCIGLDPRIEGIPYFLRKKEEKIDKILFNFNKMIIDATCDIVPVFKIQMAFYEKYKERGIKALENTIFYLRKKQKIIIIDGKRNDIGPTADAYADAYLTKEGFDADAITVNPYLGSDGINPFIEKAIKYGKGVFVLVKTSNPSSKDFQDKILKNGKRLYEEVAKMVNQWGRGTKGKNGYQVVGAVVGATYKKEAMILRKIMPKSIFLVPGYGAQGGSAKDVMVNFDKNQKGAIINNSREIIFAWQSSPYKEKFGPQKFDMAAREATIKMKKDLSCAFQI